LITPEGTKDLLFEDCAMRRSLEEKLSALFKSKGYCEIVTPGLEFFDVFNLNSRYFPQESMYKLTDNKGRLLVVRPDSTMPIARVAATRLRDSELPLRLFYRQNVYRNKPVMRGRSDEIHQMGIELIGSNSKRADLEVITGAIDVLASFENEDFRFEIGDIGFFRELVNMLGVDGGAKEEIRSLIEAKNYPALNDFLDSVGDNNVTKALKQLPRLFGGAEVLDKAERLVDDEKARNVISDLRNIYNCLAELGYNGKITVDLGIVNKLDYYTGVVIKGYLRGYGDAVLSGGRYNKLLAEFGYDVPATGFAVNVDAVAKVMKQSHTYSAPVPDVIVYGEDGSEMEAMKRAQKLRGEGLTVENSVFASYEETKAYAVKKGIPKAVRVQKNTVEETILGGSENGK
ncbi:MAG: ATP phosphoribosyltransferase regulatory subunit, partial [Muribaculaceae bacterium]|nr:ATP phosphoribosyltransferase regulatory subunit [Muribaculaceae bacterium]